MTHLTSDELIDAVEGLTAPDRQAHLASCDACRGQLADLSSVLNDAKHVSVPEPSPLFWPHFSARISAAIDTAPQSARLSWLRWQVLAPLGALAMLLLALTVAVPRREPAAVIVTDESTPAMSADDHWVVLTDLVGDFDLETANAAGLISEPGLAEQAVLELTAEERRELTRLLEAEMMRVKS